MPPLGLSKTTSIGAEDCDIDDVQDKVYNIGFINMLEILKEEINRSLEEIYKNQASSG